MIVRIWRRDYSPDTDMAQQRAWGEKMKALLRASPGFVDVQGGERIAGSHQAVTLVWWESPEAWAQFIQREDVAAVVREQPIALREEVEIYWVR